MTDTSGTDNIETPGRTKICRVCAFPMPIAGKKCTKCSSWQRWGGELGLSSDVLSMAAVLLSVSGIVMPLLINAVKPDDSDIAFSIVKIESSDDVTDPEFSADAFFSNSGTRPGLVDRAITIEATDAAGKTQTAHSIRRAFSQPQQPAVLDPGKSDLIKIEFNLLLGDWKAFRPQKCDAVLHLVDFKGADINPRVEFPCDKLNPILELADRFFPPRLQRDR